jgi:hypothetical protein
MSDEDDEIEEIEIEWGSPLHREMMDFKAGLREDWCSPETLEEARKLSRELRAQRGPEEPEKPAKKIPVYVWREAAPSEGDPQASDSAST